MCLKNDKKIFSSVQASAKLKKKKKKRKKEGKKEPSRSCWIIYQDLLERNLKKKVERDKNNFDSVFLTMLFAPFSDFTFRKISRQFNKQASQKIKAVSEFSFVTPKIRN